MSMKNKISRKIALEGAYKGAYRGGDKIRLANAFFKKIFYQHKFFLAVVG